MSLPPRPTHAPTAPRNTHTRYSMHESHAPLHPPRESITSPIAASSPQDDTAAGHAPAKEEKEDEYGGWGYDEEEVHKQPIRGRRHFRSVDYQYDRDGYGGARRPIEQTQALINQLHQGSALPVEVTQVPRHPPAPPVQAEPAAHGETGPHVPTFNGDIPAQFRHHAAHDPNRMAVPNPRTWGGGAAAPPAPAAHAPTPPVVTAAHTEQASRGWTPPPNRTDRVSAWAAGISPASPTELSRNATQTSIPTAVPSRTSTALRPDSAPPRPTPVRVEYTPSASEKSLPTPPADAPEEVPRATSPPLPKDWADDVESEKVPEAHNGQRKPPFRFGPPADNPFWWKNGPHPAYSPTWESRRIIVGLPMAVSKARVEQSMIDHFSRYGPVKLVFAADINGDTCNSVFVTFENEESALACLADPTSVNFVFRSNYAHSGAGTAITLSIRPGHFENSSRTLYICTTGPRYDEVPPAERDRKNSKKAQMPLWIYVDGVPRLRKMQTFVKRFPAVRSPYMSKEDVERRAMEQTGKDVWPIAEVYAGKDVQEKDIIPRLCNIFGEVLDVVPPMHGKGAWFVTMASYQDATRVLDQFARIPGMTARLTNASDHIGYTSPEGLASPDRRDALTRLAYYLGCPVARDDVVPSTRPAGLATPSTARSSFRELPPTPGTHVPRGLTSTRSQQRSLPPVVESAYEPSLATSHHAPPLAYVPEEDEIDPRYPHLRKRKVASYKGRPLRLDVDEQTGEERYWDDRAVHIGRLDKDRETENTIFTRFKVYGEINQIEYNPRAVTSSYATARVLFRDEASAERAIVEQNGAVSFGSQIKVEPRRVRRDNVILVEKFFDVNGRVINLSEASQCSPPLAHAPLDSSQIPHAPPINGYPMPPPGWPVQHVHTQYWHSVHPTPPHGGLAAPYAPTYPIGVPEPGTPAPPLPAQGMGMPLPPAMFSELTAMGVRFQPGGPYIHHHIIPFYPPPQGYHPGAAPPFTAYPQPPMGSHMTPPHAPDHALHVPVTTAPETPPREELVFGNIATPSHLLAQDPMDQFTPPEMSAAHDDPSPETEVVRTPGGTVHLTEKKRLLPKSTVYENGVLRAVYDQGDVDAYWRSLGLEPPAPKSAASIASEGSNDSPAAQTPAKASDVPDDPAIISTTAPPADDTPTHTTGTPFTSISPAHSAVGAGTTPLGHFQTLHPNYRPPSSLSRAGSTTTTPRTGALALPERSEEANFGPIGSPARRDSTSLPPVHVYGTHGNGGWQGDRGGYGSRGRGEGRRARAPRGYNQSEGGRGRWEGGRGPRRGSGAGAGPASWTGGSEAGH